mgnify:CR=1 FL=1
MNQQNPNHASHKQEHGQHGSHVHSHSDHDSDHNHQHDSHNHSGHDHGSHDHTQHHAMMIRDFRKRFWISLAVTLPILVLSPMIQDLLGFRFVLAGKFDAYILFALSTFVFFYGGWPFLTRLVT